MYNEKNNYSVMHLMVAILILGAFLVAGCEKPEQQVDREEVTKKVLATLYPEETRPNLEKFAYGGKEFFGRTTEELIANFGEPVAVKETPVKNTHYPEYEDIILELRFDDLLVGAYRVNEKLDPDRELIWKVEKKGNWSDPDTGVGIGLSRDEVRQILGEPDKIENGIDLYTVNTDGYPPDVIFTYENDKVAVIRWLYHID